MKTKYDIIRKLGSVSTTKLVKIRGVGKATIIDIKKQKHDTENYLKQVGPSAVDNDGKALNILM